MEGIEMRKVLLDRAQIEGTPLIEGNRATFVWEGETAPGLVGDLSGWGAHPIP